jgi:putative alpha-1,2-mannosidase
LLGHIRVKGDRRKEKLFYSLLYRTMQSPYMVSEKDGSYRSTDGSLQHTSGSVYNGWAIWDNYRTQLPLLAMLFPDRYQDITTSIANLYRYGKKDYATQHEPSNTVRTEHAIVVLLDAYRKGFAVDFKGITDSLIAEVDRLDFSHPDKALESSYDTWALSQILAIQGKKELRNVYKQKALAYKTYWNKDFKDLTKPDVDRVSARGMYQGTVWQYRWLVPFDVKGLITLTGSEEAYIKQLDAFFDNDYYNHANEPDIQAPFMYNASSQPWKSQFLAQKYAADTVVQYYFNDNSRGIDPFVDVIYQNKPDTYVRTMDDDAGAMSGWYVFAASGIFPSCMGWPVYYLSVPLFEDVKLNWQNSPFTIKVANYAQNRRYIQSAMLNGKPLTRNWLIHREIMQGGTLVITASDLPNKLWGTQNQWISSIDMN